MENTTPKKLRAKLKDYLDLAKKEIIRIKRRSGQHYILVSEEKFNELKMEVNSLQKRLIAKSHSVEKEEDNAKAKSKIKIKVKDKIKNKSQESIPKKKVKVKNPIKKVNFRKREKF
jgi:PHD/YefM family antitoxin component YafN of YafNO toxin-antitoxin module